MNATKMKNSKTQRAKHEQFVLPSYPKLCNRIAQSIADTERYIYVNESFFEYVHGVWIELHDDAVKKIIKERLGEESSKYRIDEIMNSLRLDCRVDCKMNEKTNILNLANGLFDTHNMELLDHSTSHYSTIQSPIAYTPDAKCPQWMEFLLQIFETDHEKIDYLQEMTGYLLTSSTKQEKAFIFMGPGANGKSVVLYIIEKLIGVEHCSAISMSDLKNPNLLAELYGKLVNISSEIKTDIIIEDETMKKIISGDLITAMKKYKNPFSFHPHTRLIYAVNSFPTVYDTTHAFFRRIAMVPFNKIFSEEEQDKNLKCKLESELSGILVWAIEGLRRLEKRGHFLEPKSSRELVGEFKRRSNPAQMFIEERCIIKEGARMEASMLYETYSKWAKANGLRPLSNVKFPEVLVRTYPNIKRGRVSSGCYYEGISLTRIK